MAKAIYVMAVCAFGNFVCFGSAQQFLNSLHKPKTQSSSSSQPSQNQQEQSQEQQDIQGLHFIQNFYGNPKYQKALKILDDATLQAEYEQALNDYQLQFFEYTTQVLSNYHAPQNLGSQNPGSQNAGSQNSAAKAASGQASVSVSSFLNSIKNQKSLPVISPRSQAQSVQPAAVVSESSSSNVNNVNPATSFLNSIKG